MDLTQAYRRGETEGLLRLDANEGAPPRPELMELLRDCPAEALRRYPDARALERQIAESLDLDPGCVLVTNGGDDAIDRAIRAYAGVGAGAEGSRAGGVALHAPTFSMTHRYSALAGARERATPWLRGEFPRDRFLEQGRSANLAVLTTPNNPTGLQIERRLLCRLLDELAPVPVLVDLAYLEFAMVEDAPRAELCRELLEREHVLIVRTLSKAYGLAGLRVGYALGSPARIERLRAQGSPFPVSAISLILAAKALEFGPDRDDLRNCSRRRVDLGRRLQALGLESPPSSANFALGIGGRAEQLVELLRERGVAVRAFPELPGLRITCPSSSEDWAELTAALSDIELVWNQQANQQGDQAERGSS
jgi:histidinol-phosphate aminotransferase